MPRSSLRTTFGAERFTPTAPAMQVVGKLIAEPDLFVDPARAGAPAVAAGAAVPIGRIHSGDGAPPARFGPRPEGHNVASADWDDLFRAVKDRLRLMVGADLGTADQCRAGIRECVAALDQLHSTLVHDAGRSRGLEMQVVDLHAELAQARADLAGTQACERQALHLAQHDGLTSLPNRGLFLQGLAHALDQSELQPPPLAVMFLDLDDFKRINDLHGHAVGDQVLRIVAARLMRAMRAEDMVSRLGGDEFACLLAGVSGRDQLSHLACKLFDAIRAPLKVGRQSFKVRASIGIATCPADGISGDALLHRADAAMYSAKRQHTGHAFFDERVLPPMER